MMASATVVRELKSGGSVAKSEPRQTPMGKCGHKLQRVKVWRRLEWRCTENCASPEYSHNALAARGKAK